MPGQSGASKTGLPLQLCTLQTCPIDQAYVHYLPSIAGNSLFLAIFVVILIAQLFIGIRHRTWGFLGGMFGGLVLEIIGYVGRLKMHNNPFLENNFLLYLVCLTIAPAFFAASIYLGLARIVVIYGEHVSRIRPGTYTTVFISCDIFSLVLQSIGGGIASNAPTQQKANNGIHIMAAGLAFQVASLVLFMILCSEFAFRVYKRRTELEPTHATLRQSFKFKACMYALAFATVCITIRSAFRVAELSQGFQGKLANQQVTFMILDGTMLILATTALTVFHPGLCFAGNWIDADFGVFRRKLRPARDTEKNTTTPPQTTEPEV